MSILLYVYSIINMFLLGIPLFFVNFKALFLQNVIFI
jgi:hypothetical protein